VAIVAPLRSEPDETRIILLGTKGGPRPSLHRSNPASLFVSGAHRCLIDCGYGVTRQLLTMHMPPHALTAIYITHHHSDHTLELGAVLYHAWIGGLPVASTNKGIGPGGAHSEIVYAGTPGMANHEAHARYFDPAWYRGETPVFGGADVTIEKRADLNYPVRVSAVSVPRLDLLDLDRHLIVADACGEKARGFRKLTIKAGRAFAQPGEAYGFEPRHLKAGRCEEVEITFDIEDSIRHTFMLPGLNPMFAINFIGPGTRTARFVTPDADVSLFFHCHVPAHDKTGMTGELIIGQGSPASAAKIEQVQASGSADGVGTVIATIPRSGRLVIDHEEIKGFMAAMEMAYPISQPGLLDNLGVGDRIRFTIDKSRNTITSVTVLSKGQ
jgi:Cu/Ag efflux protein CusF